MTTSLTGTSELKLGWSHKQASDFDDEPEERLTRSYKQTWAHGTAGNQVNEQWHDVRLVTASTTTDDIDLAGGETNIYGETLTFTKIKEITVVNLSTTPGDQMTVGGAGAGGNAFGAPWDGDQDAKQLLNPGGVFHLRDPIDGMTVTAGSGDVLRMQHKAGGDVTYEIIIKGIG